MRRLKKLLAGVLLCALVTGLSLPAFAAQDVVFTDDVPPGHWAESAIRNLLARDLMLGCYPVSGGPTVQYAFDLDMLMTRSDFLDIVAKFLFGRDYSGSMSEEENFAELVGYGLLRSGELDGGQLNRSLRRQEAAVILSRVLQGLGIAPADLADSSSIPDWAEAYSGCQEGVRMAWSAGLITASSTTGNFNPHGVVTNAQGAVILDRLVRLAESRGVTGANWDTGRISVGRMDGPPSMTKGVTLLPCEDWELARLPKTLNAFKRMAEQYTYGNAEVTQRDYNGESYTNFTIQYGIGINDQGYEYDLEHYFSISYPVYQDEALRTSCVLYFGQLVDGIYDTQKAFYDVYLSEITTETARRNIWAMCDDLNERGVYYNRRWLETYSDADDFGLWGRQRLYTFYRVDDGVVMGFDAYEREITLWTEAYACRDFQIQTLDEFPWFNTANKPV